MDMDNQNVLVLKDKLQCASEHLAKAPKDQQALRDLKQALESLLNEIETILPEQQLK
ncbi:hypothetical protein P2G88_12240 [Aliiglaciecola sp. CAU 1673]|uniref:hypothetical protein n=1 Tax=Aliiglaciecola sp. CAU 1673 TaxID=3032595 RepID=UPI0023DA460F|nr:hypothetical protein [Aliiglaciecola sp. CAU 1673]MDF2179021.1 hypothetical protein [Aliiglaciecola sp. CAU 1673]